MSQIYFVTGMAGESDAIAADGMDIRLNFAGITEGMEDAETWRRNGK